MDKTTCPKCGALMEFWNELDRMSFCKNGCELDVEVQKDRRGEDNDDTAG